MSVPFRLDSVHRRAEELIEALVDHGPATAKQIQKRLGWSEAKFSVALKHAREQLCPAFGFTIPAPTPSDGWKYQVTTDWEPVEAGAAYAIGLVDSRLRAIHRDVRLIMPNLTRGTVAWRRARFLDKHLSHITSTLSEISNG